MVVSSRENRELEERGEDELVLAVLRYDGPKSLYNAPALRNQGNLPSLGALQGATDGPGPWKIGLFPSKNLGYFENHSQLEIDYSAEVLAEALLEKNTLPGNIFGARVNKDLQNRVLDKVGIDELPRDSQAIRERLAEVAGSDVDPGEEAEDENFDHDLTRSELQDVARPFDPDFHLGHAGVTDLEEFLLERDDSTVRRLVQQLKNGETPSIPDETDTESSSDDTSTTDTTTTETDSSGSGSGGES